MTHQHILFIIFLFWVTHCLLKTFDPRRFPTGNENPLLDANENLSREVSEISEVRLPTFRQYWIFFFHWGHLVWWGTLVWAVYRFRHYRLIIFVIFVFWIIHWLLKLYDPGRYPIDPSRHPGPITLSKYWTLWWCSLAFVLYRFLR